MLLQKGMNIKTIAELMELNITQIYMHSETKIKLESVNKLNIF